MKIQELIIDQNQLNEKLALKIKECNQLQQKCQELEINQADINDLEHKIVLLSEEVENLQSNLEASQRESRNLKKQRIEIEKQHSLNIAQVK